MPPSRADCWRAWSLVNAVTAPTAPPGVRCRCRGPRGWPTTWFQSAGSWLASSSHTILGALLGTVGAAVQVAPSVRAVLQLAAGALIITFGLAQLGVPGFRRVTLQPPAALAPGSYAAGPARGPRWHPRCSASPPY
ncbi:hypothetical protein [Fodinicola feengrottensis]|uniref:hypothetical protein n=1 Tax=Fodinicola feengrottensis TaxID=435914 RepID=UPI0024413B3D|nr:hypothetical protein [Fodinicola feengrottensis]